MTKTLLISPKYPLPEDNGSAIRSMNFVRYFKQYGTVDILCLSSQKPSSLSKSPFTQEYFITKPTDKACKKGFVKSIYDKLIHKKTWLTNFFVPKTEIAIRDIILAENYDYIVCRYIQSAYPLLKCSTNNKKKIILDVDDIVTETLYDSSTANINGFGTLKKLIDRYILQKYYKSCFGFGFILFSSHLDKIKVSNPNLVSKCYVVPNVSPRMELPDDFCKDGHSNIRNILFVGSLAYEPNLQGIIWFIKEVFPRMVEEYEDVRLVIVGKCPPAELINLTQNTPNVELNADSPDVVPFYNKCGVVIVPLFAGGGTRLKILESGVAGRPVISTEIGAYGLGLTDEKNVMIFSDPECFIEKYKKLSNDKKHYSRIVQNLSNVITNNYSFTNFSESMDTVLSNVHM